jgi:hypothetical protein
MPEEKGPKGWTNVETSTEDTKVKRRARIRVKLTIAPEFEGTLAQVGAAYVLYLADLEKKVKALPGAVLTYKAKLIGMDQPGDGKWEPIPQSEEPTEQED